MSLIREFTKGFMIENPVLRLLIGLCPALAVTSSLGNSLGMGVAATFVLVCSNFVVSIIRKLIPDQVRIPVFIVIISTFVTIVDYVMAAYSPELHAGLGVFVPLIVVNCMILGRAEAFAYRNPALRSVIDGLGMGLGFTLALAAIGASREIIGMGTLTLWTGMSPFLRIDAYFKPMMVMVLPPGAFFAIGFIIAGLNRLKAKKAVT